MAGEAVPQQVDCTRRLVDDIRFTWYGFLGPCLKYRPTSKPFNGVNPFGIVQALINRSLSISLGNSVKSGIRRGYGSPDFVRIGKDSHFGHFAFMSKS